jgi:hypothetical protein
MTEVRGKNIVQTTALSPIPTSRNSFFPFDKLHKNALRYQAAMSFHTGKDKAKWLEVSVAECQRTGQTTYLSIANVLEYMPHSFRL